MSVEIGIFKRMISFAIQAVPAGDPAPAGGIKIATDSETELDIYVVGTSITWVKV